MSESLSSPNTRNVVIGVDVQNDFIDGSLAVPGGEEVVAPLNSLTRAARSENGIVIFTRDWHPAKTPHFDTWPVHCVQGTKGAELHQMLDVRGTDTVISKGMGQTDGYSGMEGRSLSTGQTIESLLRPQLDQEKVNVLLGGLATDYCVKATMLDIAKTFERDERVKLYLIRDAVRGVNMNPGDEAKALREMEQAGAIALSARELRQEFFGA